jgi:hypothetical protein
MNKPFEVCLLSVLPLLLPSKAAENSGKGRRQTGIESVSKRMSLQHRGANKLK